MATEPDLVSMAKALDLIAVEVAKNGNETAQLRQEMIAGFQRVDRRFDGVDHRFEGVDRRLERIETRVEDVEGELKAVRVDIADLNSRSR